MLISELPRVVRNMANANKRRQNGVNCKYDDLVTAFDWHITPEGHDFWSALNMKSRRHLKNKFNTELKK